MVMAVKVTIGGILHHTKKQGSVLTQDTPIAKLTLHEKDKISKPAIFTDDFSLFQSDEDSNSLSRTGISIFSTKTSFEYTSINSMSDKTAHG